MSDDAFLTVKELSAYIRVKPKTIYAWTARGVVPYYQLEGVIRFRKQEIDEWLDRCSCPAHHLVRQRVTDLGNRNLI